MMDLRLTPTEELALMKALQLHYLKDAEKLGEEEGARSDENVNGLISRTEAMPTDEVQLQGER